jgi:ABC-type nitrate/sulfonate/bicarbonate transport system ATPase subunit
MGKSGLGKSSLLKCISGLNLNFTGEIKVGGVKIDSVRNDLGFCFQDYSLFPWLTVSENILIASKYKKSNKEKLVEVLETVGLYDSKDKFPHQLSGGMKQRTAIARVLYQELGILLMDEPFGALDYQTRLEMQEFLLKIWELQKPTIVFVTHNVDEAVSISDRVIIMQKLAPFKVIPIEMGRPRMNNFSFIEYRNQIIGAL